MNVFDEIEKKQKEIEELKEKAKKEREENKVILARTNDIVSNVMKQCYAYRKLGAKAKMDFKILEKISTIVDEKVAIEVKEELAEIPKVE